MACKYFQGDISINTRINFHVHIIFLIMIPLAFTERSQMTNDTLNHVMEEDKSSTHIEGKLFKKPNEGTKTSEREDGHGKDNGEKKLGFPSTLGTLKSVGRRKRQKGTKISQVSLTSKYSMITRSAKLMTQRTSVALKQKQRQNSLVTVDRSIAATNNLHQTSSKILMSSYQTKATITGTTVKSSQLPIPNTAFSSAVTSPLSQVVARILPSVTTRTITHSLLSSGKIDGEVAKETILNPTVSTAYGRNDMNSTKISTISVKTPESIENRNKVTKSSLYQQLEVETIFGRSSVLYTTTRTGPKKTVLISSSEGVTLSHVPKTRTQSLTISNKLHRTATKVGKDGSMFVQASQTTSISASLFSAQLSALETRPTVNVSNTLKSIYSRARSSKRSVMSTSPLSSFISVKGTKSIVLQPVHTELLTDSTGKQTTSSHFYRNRTNTAVSSITRMKPYTLKTVSSLHSTTNNENTILLNSSLLTSSLFLAKRATQVSGKTNDSMQVLLSNTPKSILLPSWSISSLLVNYSLAAHAKKSVHPQESRKSISLSIFSSTMSVQQTNSSTHALPWVVNITVHLNMSSSNSSQGRKSSTGKYSTYIQQKQTIITKTLSSSIYWPATNKVNSQTMSTTVSRSSSRTSQSPPVMERTTPTTKTSTKKEETTGKHFTLKPPLKEMPVRVIGHSKTTIIAHLDLRTFNLKKALKADILMQRYDPNSVDFEGITALPPVTWFKVHYQVSFSYRRYIAASLCLQYANCNKGSKPAFGLKSRQKRQLIDGILVFRAGEEKDCQNRRGKTDYCNGPLEPNTKYRFQILIHYTDSSHISTTPFSQPIMTDASPKAPLKPSSKPKSASNQTTLIIIIIVVLIVLLLVFLVLMTISKKRNGRQGPYGHNGELKCALISTFRTHSGCSCTQPAAVEQGFQLRPISKGMSRPVSVKDFHAWVMRSSADSDFRFAEEFESIRDVGRDQSHEASDMPENRGKNRYVNVLAYDHTRVKLSYTDDEAGSDYINANYIHGYKQPRAYIATQGPLPGTTDDFWRMVWEQNSHVIVMITQVTERTRVKCHKYWPGIESTTYGDITVSLLSDYAFPNWSERELLLEVEGEESRRIHHFQYTSWPDHGVPKTTSDILEFQSTVQAHCLTSHGPVIVHCSAGVGRTGTFIAIDTIIKRLHEEMVIDIYGTVCLMRLQRCSMVQTEDQYIYIHRAILEYIKQREMNTHIFKGYSLLPLEERELLDSDRGSEDIAPTSPLLGADSVALTLSPGSVTDAQSETSPL